MSGSIKGIIVEIGGDTSGLQKALSKVNSATSSLSRELRGINSLLKLDPKNTELLKQKQDVLNQSITTTEDKLKQLKEIKNEADKKMSEGTKINEENYRALQREIINTENKLANLKNETSNWAKTAKKLIQWSDNLDNISSRIDNLGNKLSTRLTLPITALATTGIAYNAQLEKYTKSFETFLGDAEKASKAVEKIKEDSVKTPFDVTSLVQANQMLIATEEEAGNSRETILALGDAIAATGGGNDELTRMAQNLQQIKNAGKASAIDIKQFAYAGIDVYGILADYMGKTTEEIKDMEISYEDLTEALKKANKQGGKYYNAMSNVSETLTGQVNQLKAETKDMTGQLTKSLMPTAKKLVGQAKDLISKFDNLSDSQKENIVKIGLWVAATGPALKVIGTLTSATGKVAKSLGTMTQAIGVLRGEMTSSNAAVKSTAKVIGLLANPTGVAIASIGALAGAYTWLKKESEKIPEELQKTIDKMEESKNAHVEYRTELDKTTSSSLAEIENTENLRNELTKLVDENGKVKEGYKDRVSVILNELNKALGTEYSLTGDIISQYQTLQQEIDLLILKKKAQIILENEESKYATAIQNKTSAYKTMIDAQNEYNKALEGKTYEQYFNDLQQKYVDAGYTVKKSAEHAKEHMEKWVDGYKQTYEKSRNIYNDYLTDIAKYENDYAVMQSNNTEKIKQMTDERINSYGREHLSRETQIQEGIQQEIYNINELKKIYQEDLNNKNEISAQANAFAIESSKQRLQTLLSDLTAQTSAINENSPKVIEAWKQLATNSYSAYYDQVSLLPEELSRKIQEMTGITVERTPELVDETKNMSNQVLVQIENNEEFRKEAIQNLQGYLNGLQDNELRELLKEVGLQNVDTVIRGIREGNLAEDEGTEILKSLNTGLSNSSWQKTLWDKARDIASTLSSLLTVKANVNGSTANLPGHKSGLDYVPYDDYIARLHKGERVLTAEENKQLMQMEKASRLKVPNMKAIGNSIVDSMKTVFTTPNITFNVQKMDEANLNSAFNYINRRLGSQY